MFRRQRHQLIANVLSAFDRNLLQSHFCYFGGGTAIAMRYGEYRTSFDIDFMISDLSGYRELRSMVKLGGLGVLIQPEYRQIVDASLAKTDQYGIRGSLMFGGNSIKFEIVAEGRIELETPTKIDQIEGVTTLTEVDLVAEKLLANSDRYADRGVFNRDVIDLAFMDLGQIRNHEGFIKAREAYGETIAHDLDKAVQLFIDQPDWLQRCIANLEIEHPRAVVLQKLTSLV